MLKTGLEILDLGVIGIQMEDKATVRADVSWVGASVKRKWSRTELNRMFIFTGGASQGQCERAARERISVNTKKTRGCQGGMVSCVDALRCLMR